MRSLAVTIDSALPSRAAEPRPDEAISVRLQRLCGLLGIAGARLSTLAADGLSPIATAGTEAALSALEARMTAASQPLVLGDTGLPAARFYAGIVLPEEGDRPARLLSLFDPHPRSPGMATTIAALAGEVLAQAAMARQRRQIEELARTIADYAALEDQRRTLFDRASATAHIGIWQCNLGDNSLTWTNGVYDLFEIPRNTPVTRDMTLALYTDASRQQMEAARAVAIATCSDFSLDAEIITVKGKRRWMRLTGAVESRDGVAHRIFGMKQDITEEKLMADRTRYLAEFDVMTGLANRSLFQARLSALDEGRQAIGALLLVDLDGFKQVNDTYGHAIGDECLKEAALRLVESCSGADLVARIGGDEFAVLLNEGTSRRDADMLASGIVEIMARPITRIGQTLKLGASVGVAHNRGGSSEDLFRQADTALYAAKAAGRATSRTFAA
ncbi:sensor domain-containing diguanylate cyclase [Devosia sp. Root436]|uniref:sensor domain-containing diguanylate cyclase n=1 Tax=Devosia sp. Root436 TaxID=1736537 RepID=UPI000ADDF3B0|nr:sensor domain-containing diguanylate cyclase [Devosia sp. Root436]